MYITKVTKLDTLLDTVLVLYDPQSVLNPLYFTQVYVSYAGVSSIYAVCGVVRGVGWVSRGLARSQGSFRPTNRWSYCPEHSSTNANEGLRFFYHAVH